MELNEFLNSMAVQTLKLFWIAADLFFIGYYLYLGHFTVLSFYKLVSLLVIVNIAIIPIWFVSSCLNDMADPYISVWDHKDEWDK